MRLDKFGSVKFSIKEEQLFGIPNELQSMLLSQLAVLAMHPWHMKHFLELEKGKSYRYIDHNNGDKDVFDPIPLQGPVDFYANGDYKLNEFYGVTLQELLKRSK
jgi:hypothetical protein